MRVGEFKGKTFLKGCNEYELVIQVGPDETSAKDSFEIKMVYQHENGYVPCTAFGSSFATWKASGWQEMSVLYDETENPKGEYDYNPNATGATGAKSLAAAFTATALTVAATNF